MKADELKIAVLTSGGDAPGMNAAIRAVTRTALFYGIDIYGVYRGYQGLIDDDMVKMQSKFVANIIQRGGTALKTARCEDFLRHEGRAKAYENLCRKSINALVVIGGDGSFRGAKKMSEEFGIRTVGIPATIDKDISGTDYTIGFDTALNTAIEAIDRIRDTAESHDRLFIVEVMGRDAGYIALDSGIAAGATGVFIREIATDVQEVCELIEMRQQHRKKETHILIVAEGATFGKENEKGAYAAEKYIRSALPFFDIRVTVLGHIQRGGRPTAIDRIFASRMGFESVKALMDGKNNVCVGIKQENICFSPFVDTPAKPTYPGAQLSEYVKLFRVLSE